MNSKIVTALVLGAASLAVSARGQIPTSTEAPPATPAVAPSVAQTAPTPAAKAPNQIVYAPRLPSVADLTNAAAAQGATIERIEQTSALITVVYKYANGQFNTVAYQLLPSSGGASSALSAPGSPAPVVVYQQAPRVVYYDSFGPGYYYDPYYYWYPPVSVRLGFGYRSGGHHRGR